MGDRSGLDFSEEKSTKKKNLYDDIEELFSKDLMQNSKESSSSNSKAKEYEL